jgi:hypothetical protein
MTREEMIFTIVDDFIESKPAPTPEQVSEFEKSLEDKCDVELGNIIYIKQL